MKTPLAFILRPQTLNDLLGQEHILGEDSVLRDAIKNDSIKSMIFFGGSGYGKSTLAEIISNTTKAKFIKIDATEAKISDIRSIISQANINKDLDHRKTLLAVDEIHRLTKNVQDVLLPCTENGKIILIGMTTVNPYFAVNHALISRSIILELRPLNKKEMTKLILKVVKYYNDNNIKIKIDKESAKYLISMSGGDARRLITAMEFIVDSGRTNISLDICKQVMPTKFSTIDRETAHFDALSAVQGCVQASDVNGAIFWLGQVINSGGDIESICRRLLVTASEDVGCCNPMALVHTYSAVKSALIVGLPEARIILASAVAYLAMNKRSKAAHDAINTSIQLDLAEDIRIPDWLRDCHYEGRKELGHGEYRDGQNMDVYTKFPKKIFYPVAGEEIELMKHNEELWNSRST